MSESYPRSNTWPFVLSGLLLFGLVLLPPTQWPRAVRDIYVKWNEVREPAKSSALASATKGPVSRVVVGHNPWGDQSERSLAEESKVVSAPVSEPVHIGPSPAPTWNLHKTEHTPTDATHEHIVAAPVVSTSAPMVAKEAVTSGYIWQPPRDWVPELIEPYVVSSRALASTKPASLVAVPIAEPVAKLETLRKPIRRPRPVPATSLSQPIDNLLVSPEIETESPNGTDIAQEVPVAPRVLPSEISPGGTQYISRNLEQLLEAGVAHHRLARWSQQLRTRLTQFRHAPVVGSASQQRAVEQLAALATYPVDRSRWTLGERQTYWRIRHAVQRRTDVWDPLLKTAANEKGHAVDVHQQLGVAAKELKAALRSDTTTSGWADYLRLDALSEADSAELSGQAAEVTLALLRNPDLGNAQVAFLSSAPLQEFETRLRASISAGVSASQIIDALEAYEDASHAKNGQATISLLQRFGTGPYSDRYVSVIRALDTHYRNANIRVAVTEELINSFVPAFHQYAEQVNDTILGAAVRGRNSTQTNLAIKLIPDDQAIRVALLAKGMVDSDTASRKGPVVFFNQGTSRFAAGKELVIDSNGIFMGQTETRASTGTRVVGLKSDLDRYPLLGWVVRSIARQQHDEQRPFLRAEVLHRVRRQATQKLDIEVQRRMANVEERVQSRLVQPLRDLELDPRALEMKTTGERVVLRTRLAGPLQLGSHTPRPQARSDSKLSFQIHQSAASNLIQQFNLHGRRLTLGELASEMSARFGMNLEVSEKRRGTTIEFASDRPFDIEFDNGQVQITLHIAELDSGDDRWENFSVRGFYRADVRQMDVELIRDGSIELITDSLRLRDQIALRGIFTKVFADNQRLDLLRRAIQNQPSLRELAVSQFTIRDGWISVSVGEKLLSSPRIASRP